jgi:hypothetical protein
MIIRALQEIDNELLLLDVKFKFYKRQIVASHRFYSIYFRGES